MATKEVFVNFPNSALLNGAHTAAATTINITQVGTLPTSGQYRLSAPGGEIILVNAALSTSTSLSVQRGQEGTTAAAISDGVYLVPVVTDQALRNIFRQSVGGSNIAARREINFLTGGGLSASVADDSANDKADVILTSCGTAAVKPSGPPATGWSTLNAAASFSYSFPVTNVLTLVDTGAASSGENIRFLYQAAPGSTPWTLKARVMINSQIGSGTSSAGLMVGDSVSGKLVGLAIRQSGGSAQIYVYQWSNATTYVSSAFGPQTVDLASVAFLAIQDDGTNLNFLVSSDGNTYIKLASQGRTSFLTNAPNQVGLYVNTYDANKTCSLACNHFTLG